MKRKLRKPLAFLLSFMLMFSLLGGTAFADTSADTGSPDVTDSTDAGDTGDSGDSAGSEVTAVATYDLDVVLDCSVNTPFGLLDFGDGLVEGAQAVENSDGTYTVTVNFTTSSITVMTITATTFVDATSAAPGYYDPVSGELVTEGVTYTLSENTAPNTKSVEVNYVDSMTFTVSDLTCQMYLYLYIESSAYGAQFCDGSGSGDTNKPGVLTPYQAVLKISSASEKLDDSTLHSFKTTDDGESYQCTGCGLSYTKTGTSYEGTGFYADSWDTTGTMIYKYFGYETYVSNERADGTYDVIVYYGGDSGYSDAIGDFTVYTDLTYETVQETVSASSRSALFDDPVYVFNVSDPAAPIYVSLYVGGTMDMDVTFTINPGTEAEDLGIVEQWGIGSPVAYSVVATLYEDGTLAITGEGETQSYIAYSYVPWMSSYQTAITTVSMESTVTPSDMACWFYGCTNLTTLADGFTIPDTVTNAKYTFYNCSSLKSLPDSFKLSSNLENAYQMFYGCKSLTMLSEGFTIPDTVTTAYSMFYNCQALQSLPDGFTIGNGVTTVYRMFYKCSSLTELPDSFRIGSSVETTAQMFYGCSSLESLSESLTIPDAVTTTKQMFYGCTSLASLPDGFTIPNAVTTTQSMFNSCTSLASLPDDFAIGSSVTTATTMFNGCSSLTVLPDGFTIPETVTTKTNMFGLGSAYADNYLTTYCTSSSYDSLSSAYDWSGSYRTLTVCDHDTVNEEADWNWAKDYSSATLDYTCACGTKVFTSYAADVTAETVDATCTEDGLTTYTAAVVVEGEDGEATTYTDTQEVVIPALGHDFTVTFTWSEDYDTVITKAVCANDSDHNVTGAADVTVETVEPTCTEDGATVYTATFTAADGYTYTDTRSIDPTDATGHSYEVTETVDATCTEAGSVTYTCSACGDSYTETIAATGHDYKVTFTWSADYLTAFAKGTCANDDSHTFLEEAAVTKETTGTLCNGSGEEIYTASATVGLNTYTSTRTVALAKTAHNLTAVEAVEATCGTAGNIAYYVCADCGDYFADKDGTEALSEADIVLAATGEHSYEAVTNADGSVTYTCSVCGNSYTDVAQDEGGDDGDEDTVSQKVSSSTVAVTAVKSSGDTSMMNQYIEGTAKVVTYADGSATVTFSFTETGASLVQSVTCNGETISANEDGSYTLTVEDASEGALIEVSMNIEISEGNVLAQTAYLQIGETLSVDEIDDNEGSESDVSYYSVGVELRNASNTDNASACAAIMESTGYITKDADGNLILTVYFVDGAEIRTFASHATGIDVYEADGTTKMDVAYTTYETELYTSLMGTDTETGTAVSAADISLSYQAEDGIYQGYIYSDRMDSAVALYVDFDNMTEIDAIPERTTEAAVYTGSAVVDGYYYTLSVSVTVEDGVITAVEVTSDGEDGINNGEHDGSLIYYNQAVEALEAALIGVSATQEGLDGVDTVSGATMTSDAIIDAIIDALGLDTTNEVTGITLEAGKSYTVDITYKAAAHSLVSNPTATADDDSDTVSATIVVDEDGNAFIVIDLYNSEDMYITDIKGIRLGGTTDGTLTMDGVTLVTAENADLTGGTYVTQVTFPLDGIYAEYYTSADVYVPAMVNVDMDGDGEADNGYFNVDPSTLTIDWDTLTETEASEGDQNNNNNDQNSGDNDQNSGDDNQNSGDDDQNSGDDDQNTGDDNTDTEAQTAAQAVIDAINAIGTVTADSGDAIAAARAAYDALSDEAKALVTNLDTLTAAESAYASLVSETDQQTEKQAQTIKVVKKSVKKTVKAKKLKSKKQTFKIKTTVKGNAKVTYKKVKAGKNAKKAYKLGKKYLKVSKNGKVTVKKGTPKGAYKIKVKVKAKASSAYKKATKTITITVKVK